MLLLMAVGGRSREYSRTVVPEIPCTFFMINGGPGGREVFVLQLAPAMPGRGKLSAASTELKSWPRWSQVALKPEVVPGLIVGPPDELKRERGIEEEVTIPTQRPCKRSLRCQ